MYQSIYSFTFSWAKKLSSKIKNKTKTAVINIREFLHLYKLDVSYAIQHTFSKVILSDR